MTREGPHLVIIKVWRCGECKWLEYRRVHGILPIPYYVCTHEGAAEASEFEGWLGGSTEAPEWCPVRSVKGSVEEVADEI